MHRYDNPIKRVDAARYLYLYLYGGVCGAGVDTQCTACTCDALLAGAARRAAQGPRSVACPDTRTRCRQAHAHLCIWMQQVHGHRLDVSAAARRAPARARRATCTCI